MNADQSQPARYENRAIEDAALELWAQMHADATGVTIAEGREAVAAEVHQMIVKLDSELAQIANRAERRRAAAIARRTR